MHQTLITIIGPTGIGKTALAIKLAQHFSTDIISSDSRQFYKEMFIGTAKPTSDEMQGIPHYFINHLSIHDSYSVGDFEREVKEKLEGLFKVNKVIIMVGGSGLYEKAVTEGLDEFPPIDSQIRKNLKTQLETQGIKTLQNLLLEKDSTFYSIIDIHNSQRLIRALEVCIATGLPYSSFRKNKKSSKRNFTTLKIGLTASRSVIYERINTRVDTMIENGLINEAEKLFPYKNLNALNTVGYKELFQYFEGKQTLEKSIEDIKKNTRRFAKRQLTWYNKDTDIHWFDHNQVAQILTFLHENKNIVN